MTTATPAVAISRPCITFCVGPAGSGKSAWAHDQVDRLGSQKVQRVNLDDFIAMTHGREYGDLTSEDIKLTRRLLIHTIRTIADSGRDVIVDNAHLSTRFPNLVRDELGDGFEYRIQDFTVIPLDEAVRQDARRKTVNPTAFLGREEVIRQWKKGESLRYRFGGPGLPDWVEDLNRSDGITPYIPDPRLPKCVIVDIDGTLALATSRHPYDTTQYLSDELEHRLARLVNDLVTSYEPYQIVIVTGRDEAHRNTLEEWLEREHVRWDEIYMRPRGDIRRHNMVKLDLFNAYLRDRFNVIAAFDDRDRVVRLWRRLGLLTLQAAEGDF